MRHMTPVIYGFRHPMNQYGISMYFAADIFCDQLTLDALSLEEKKTI